MGRAARANRAATTLPEDQWWCLWCDAHPPIATFNRREHVIAEGLGGPRDFRLMRGLVCDGCNSGVLQKIDEELMLVGWIRWMRAWLGVGPRFQGIAPGLVYDRHSRETRIDFSKLNAATQIEMRSGSFTATSTGPSAAQLVRNEHVTRGFHRMAFNAVAHARGAAYVREHLLFLRELILDLDRITHRGTLIGYEALKRAIMAQGTAEPSRYRVHNDDEGQAEIVELHVGPLPVYVSVKPSTAPLARVKAQQPELFVYSQLDA